MIILPVSDQYRISIEGVMVRIVAIITTVLLFPALSVVANADLRLHGSNTVGEKFAPMLIKQFARQQKAVFIEDIPGKVDVENSIIAKSSSKEPLFSVELFAHGSSTGFKALLDKQADIAMSSRPIKIKEVNQLLKQFPSISEQSSEHPIAYDALAIVVNPTNGIEKLSLQQLAAIYSGEVTNWVQLGGANVPIQLMARDDNSGTYDTFKSLVLKPNNAKLSGNALRFESSHQLISQVVNNHGAIGFVGIAHVGNSKLLSISKTADSPAILPNKYTIGTEGYPLSRKLYMYLPKENKSDLAQSFIDFVTSNEGQQLAEKVGLTSYFPLTSNPKVSRINFPKKYANLAEYGQRLSVVFTLNSKVIDSKAERDIERVRRYFEKNPYKQLVFAAVGENNHENQSYISDWLTLLSDKLNDVGSAKKQVLAMQSASQLKRSGVEKNPMIEVWAL